MPAFGEQVVADTHDNVWVQDFAGPGETATQWSVFAADGRWLGSLDLLPGLRVLTIASDRLVGLRRDRLDVEILMVLAILRPN